MRPRAALLAVAVVVGASGTGDAVATNAVIPAIPAAVASSDAYAPCTATQTRGVIGRFLKAWTRGGSAAIDRLVVREPLFRFVSVARPGARIGGRAFDRSTLTRYFRARHRQHDRVVLRSFRFHGSDLRGRHWYGHAELELTRDADDWPADLEHLRSVKSAIICSLKRPGIAVFSLG
jgi:hypothetical protein